MFPHVIMETTCRLSGTIDCFFIVIREIVAFQSWLYAELAETAAANFESTMAAWRNDSLTGQFSAI